VSMLMFQFPTLVHLAGPINVMSITTIDSQLRSFACNTACSTAQHEDLSAHVGNVERLHLRGKFSFFLRVTFGSQLGQSLRVMTKCFFLMHYRLIMLAGSVIAY
jgi:hypothetical protein